MLGEPEHDPLSLVDFGLLHHGYPRAAAAVITAYSLADIRQGYRIMQTRNTKRRELLVSQKPHCFPLLESQ
jgi:hypothetical protein